MKHYSFKEIKAMTRSELKEQLQVLGKTLLWLRIQKKTNQEGVLPHVFKEVRRQKARVLMAMGMMNQK